MSAVVSARSFLGTLAGIRPMIQTPNSQWRSGPFALDVTIADGTATNVDLTTHDAWYGDPSVAQAYTLSDGSSTDVKATVHIESVELVMITGAFSLLAAATKDNIVDEMYLEANVNSSTAHHGLFGAISEALTVTATTATTTTSTRLEGAAKVLPHPMRVDLENNQMALRSRNAVGMGATFAGKLVLDGAIFPATAGVPGAIAGQCGSDRDARGQATSIAAVRSARAERIQIARLTTKGRPS